MSILADNEIKALCIQPTVIERKGYFGSTFEKIKKDNNFRPMLFPYIEGQVREKDGKKILSYGTSSYGYDVRIANKFKVFTNINSTVIDPLNFNDKNYVDVEGDVCIIPPNSFVLTSTIEYFCMPKDVTGIVLGKSTYARTGCNCIATPIEAGWEGELVLEFANTTPLPMKLYANQGAAQVLFFRGNAQCSTDYSIGNRKYQGQLGITLPKG